MGTATITLKLTEYAETCKRFKQMEEALEQCERLFKEALPKFNWRDSALDANAIMLLNDAPGLVAKALKEAKKENL